MILINFQNKMLYIFMFFNYELSIFISLELTT